MPGQLSIPPAHQILPVALHSHIVTVHGSQDELLFVDGNND